jgi:hypothetical protein
MKEGLRLAQSIALQPFEKIGIFNRLSRRRMAVSGQCKKPDSKARFRVPESGVFTAPASPFPLARAFGDAFNQ